MDVEEKGRKAETDFATCTKWMHLRLNSADLLLEMTDQSSEREDTRRMDAE